jgi:hypothetical protein
MAACGMDVVPEQIRLGIGKIPGSGEIADIATKAR